jgi:hypothetical protein
MHVFTDIAVPFEADGTGELLCPCCGSHYLHHDKVHIYSRTQEDATSGVHVLVSPGGEVVTDLTLRHNPSRRRDGLRIEFWCEECHAKPWLDIAQHKGNTHLCWANGSELQSAARKGAPK